MKHLGEYIYEGLFDKDLTNKEFGLDPDAVWETIQNRIYNKLCDKCINSAWMMSLNRDGLCLMKTINGVETDGVEKNYDHNLFIEKNYDIIIFKFDKSIYNGFPELPIISILQNHDPQFGFSSATVDRMGTRRWIEKKFDNIAIKEDRGKCNFVCNSKTMDDVIDVMTRLITELIKDDTTKKIIKVIKQYLDNKKSVPGISLDHIMKEIINKA